MGAVELEFTLIVLLTLSLLPPCPYPGIDTKVSQ